VRLQQRELKWEEQLPSLIDAYLDYKERCHKADALGNSGGLEQFELLYIDVYGASSQFMYP
jgi:hypothetical protein